MFEVPMLNNKARSGIYAPGQERVVQILETAVAILIEDGIGAVTLREIARRMGIRSGAIYHYYATREELILDMLSGVLKSYEDFFVDFREVSDQPPEARLRAFIGTVLDDIQTLRTTRLFPELWILSERDEQVARMVDAIYIRSRLIAKRFILAINPALDPRTLENLALFVCGSLEGMTVFAGHRKPWAGEMERLKTIAADAMIAAVKAARPDPDADPDWRAPTLLDAESYAALTAPVVSGPTDDTPPAA
jgi:AcrR family transcriptional regulator